MLFIEVFVIIMEKGKFLGLVRISWVRRPMSKI
jgi:hypothetical protein